MQTEALTSREVASNWAICDGPGEGGCGYDATFAVESGYDSDATSSSYRDAILAQSHLIIGALLTKLRPKIKSASFEKERPQFSKYWRQLYPQA